MLKPASEHWCYFQTTCQAHTKLTREAMNLQDSQILNTRSIYQVLSNHKLITHCLNFEVYTPSNYLEKQKFETRQAMPNKEKVIKD